MRAMKWILLVMICAMLTGCQVSAEIENQAYAIALGIDRGDAGELILTARIPRTGRSGGGNEKQSSESSPYLVFSASGVDYERALEALEWATPRRLNLSHMEMLVVSERLAGEEGFPALLERIAGTPHLYNTARLVACKGSAGDFVEAAEPVIGMRLSSEIKAMMRHYIQKGYIPDSRVADLYYANHSACSDPVAIFAELAPQEGKLALAADSDPAATVARIEKTPMRQCYTGAALFSRGRLVHTLGLDSTQLLNLMRGSSRPLTRHYPGLSCDLAAERVERHARIENGALSLEVNMTLSATEAIPPESTSDIEARLRHEAAELIAACQRCGADPFGFTESAMSRFPTMAEWLSYDWHRQYASAPVLVTISIRGPGERG